MIYINKNRNIKDTINRIGWSLKNSTFISVVWNIFSLILYWNLENSEINCEILSWKCLSTLSIHLISVFLILKIPEFSSLERRFFLSPNSIFYEFLLGRRVIMCPQICLLRSILSTSRVHECIIRVNLDFRGIFWVHKCIWTESVAHSEYLTFILILFNI